jgi:hypothetical protein
MHFEIAESKSAKNQQQVLEQDRTEDEAADLHIIPGTTGRKDSSFMSD